MRTARLFKPSVAYHLISRFFEKRWFIAGDEERNMYLKLLGHALVDSDWRCTGYAVMSNHVHLMAIAGTQPLASWLRRVHSPFATWINERNDRIGPVFVRGPKDFEIRPENEAHVMAYVHNNPVAAGVVSRAAASDWTSHRAYTGRVAPPRWLHVDDGLARCGFQNGDELDRWVDATPGDPGIVELGLMRRAAHWRGALELATPASNPTEVPLIAPPWACIRIDPRDIIATAAEQTRESVSKICSRSKRKELVSIRRSIVHAAQLIGICGSEIASALGMTQQGASKLGRSATSASEKQLSDRIVRRLEEVVKVVSVPTRLAS